MKRTIQVQVTSREWRERTFQLSGAAQATIEYEVEEVGRERVFVNGRVAVDSAGDTMALRRRQLSFHIPVVATAGLAAVVDIRDGGIFGSAALRLSLDGEVVFEDRAFARLDRQLRTRRLPLAAKAPPLDRPNLPLPGHLEADVLRQLE